MELSPIYNVVFIIFVDYFVN